MYENKIADRFKPAARYAIACFLIIGGFLLVALPVLAQDATEESDSATTDEVMDATEEAPPDSSESDMSATEDAPPESESVASEESADDSSQPSTKYCLLCHSDENLVWKFEDGYELSLTIDPTVLADSVHGEQYLTEWAAEQELEEVPEPLECNDCHLDYRYPHPRQTGKTLREFKIERYASCRTCHEDQYLHAQDSVHGDAIREGNLQAAVCVDCHGGHDIQVPDEPRQRIPFTCGECHGAIFDRYQSSVHGVALLGEDNPDVPTCVDCHGVHGISNPDTVAFRTLSPEVCGQCHANENLMNKYDISTEVFDSYLGDFHGATVTLFEHETPDVPTNKAVCIDCHSVHSIQKISDGDTEPIREHLLETCRQCHPDADANFPDAWIGHYTPKASDHPILFVIKSLYKVLLPLGMVVFIGLPILDILRRIRRPGDN